MKQAGDFEKAVFLGEDFDGTIADTFTAPRGGFSVEAAYRIAIGEVFGTSSLYRYNQAGGLRNRAPVDVVRELAPDADVDQTTALLARLDSAKLEVLSSQINASWPEPIPGFIDFTTKLRKTQTSRPIDDVIVSSGHESFINATFEKTFGLEPPKIILAQEAIQRIALSWGEAMPTKPSPRLLLYAYNEWRLHHDETSRGAIDMFDISRMQYIGDDPVKDGVMARQSGINFMLMSSDNPAESWQKLAARLMSTEQAA